MRLRVIEIDVLTRRHDDIVMLFGGIDTAFFAAPAHDRGVGGDTAFEDLVPADDAFAFAVDVFLHALDEPALQLVFVLETELFHPLLTFGAGLPAILGTFVAADVNIRSGKERMISSMTFCINWKTLSFP